MNSGDKRTYEVIGMAFVVVERLYLLDKKCLKTYIKLFSSLHNICFLQMECGRKRQGVVRNVTLDRRILAPTCLLSHPNVLSPSSAPRVCPLA